MSNPHGNWVRGNECCHLVWEVVSSRVYKKEYPQLWEL
jgi:hypothetical protein